MSTSILKESITEAYSRIAGLKEIAPPKTTSKFQRMYFDKKGDMNKAIAMLSSAGMKVHRMNAGNVDRSADGFAVIGSESTLEFMNQALFSSAKSMLTKNKVSYTAGS